MWPMKTILTQINHVPYLSFIAVGQSKELVTHFMHLLLPVNLVWVFVQRQNQWISLMFCGIKVSKHAKNYVYFQSLFIFVYR